MRTSTIVALLAGAALAAPAAASADGPASVKVTGCKTGSDALARTATFRGRMKAVPGSVRMRMRFELIARSGIADAQTTRSVLGHWRRSDPGVTTFAYKQRVRGLDAGVAYRVRVKFRWYGEDGKIMQRATRRSGACVQDGELPNLELLSVRVSPRKNPDTALYSIDIGNTGEGPAEFFVITLFVTSAGQEAEVDHREIERIEPGETATIKFTGPVCTRLRAVVDLGRSVPETIEDDNALKTRC